MKVSIGLEPRVWSFEMEVIPKIEGNNVFKDTCLEVIPKIEGNNAFKEHLIGNSPKIERKYFKGNFIDNPFKENFTDNTF